MRTTLRTGISLLLILILTIGMSVPVLAENNNDKPNDVHDPDMGEMCESFKIDDFEITKLSYNVPYTKIADGYSFKITLRLTEEGQVIDWESNVAVSHVWVKASDGGELYSYNPPATSDTGLHGPYPNENASSYADISHITFYVCGDDDEDEASINIEKATNGYDADTPTGPFIPVGAAVTWTYVVTNTGEVTLSNIIVVDDQGVTVTMPKTTLAPGESMTGTAHGTAVAGQYANLGTVTGTPPEGSDVTASDPSHYFGSNASIDIEKLVSVNDGETWHDADSPTGPTATYPGMVKFKVIVTNTGNVTLTGIDVDDTDFEFEGVATTLAPGDSDESTVKEVASVLGQHSNTADVEGFYGEMKVTDSDMAHYIAYEEPVPSIDIEKWVSVDDGETWHDADSPTGPTANYPGTVKFKVIVTNTGNVALTGIDVDDTDFEFEGIVSTLAPGAFDESDIKEVASADGQHSNTADVEGFYGEVKVSDSDMAHYIAHEEFEPDPSIDIEKWVSVDGGETWQDADSPTGPTIRLPGTVRFKVIVTNTGNVPLTGIVVDDTDFEFMGVVTSLAAGAHDESNVMAIPAERYQHSNTADVEGFYGEMKVTDSDMAHYYGDYERRDDNDPDISIKKYVSVDGGATWDDAENAPGPRASFPGTVQFKVVVKNTGDYRLTDIEVNDTDFDFTGVASSLNVGDSDTSDIITVATIEGQHSNTADVEGFYGSQKVTDSDMAHYYTQDDDKENGMIKIHKFMDENENGTQDAGEFHMQNVTFELYNADKSEMLSSKQTDNEGNLTFSNLAFGTYNLKEKSEYDITTSGFDDDGFMQITVNSEATITIIVGNDIDRELESDNIVIEEPVPLALPQTGELPPTQFYILGALLMLAGMFLKRFE
jgi:LPXTG-motif cell wall-anchored protein